MTDDALLVLVASGPTKSPPNADALESVVPRDGNGAPEARPDEVLIVASVQVLRGET